MSNDTGSTGPATSGESIARTLVRFLAAQSSRYVPFPPTKTCDAIFVNPWFEYNFFPPAQAPASQRTEPLLELLQWDFGRSGFGKAAVLSIKQFFINRHGSDNERFRLRWTYEDEESSDLFLISCQDCPDHVAVVPTQYLRTRYAGHRIMEEAFESGQACPSLLAPFMVHHQHLITFFHQIYLHASRSDTADLVNPTFRATYYGWRPALHYLRDVLPRQAARTKLTDLRYLYFACKLTRSTFKLALRGDAGDFFLNGSPVEYWRKTWMRRGSSHIKIILRRKIPINAPWKFLLLGSHDGREAVFLPRNSVPPELVGHPKREAARGSLNWPHCEVLAEEWARFTFTIRDASHYAAMLDALTTLHARSAVEGLESALRESDSSWEDWRSSETRWTSASWRSDSSV